MKMAISLILYFWTSTAWTLNKNSAWEEIFRTRNVQLNYDAILGRIELKNACLTEDKILSIQPFRWCNLLVPEKWGKGTKDTFIQWVCKDWVVEHDWYPRTLYRERCDKYEQYGAGRLCKRWLNYPVKVPKTIKVHVHHAASYTHAIGFDKLFTFPDCEE